MLVTLGMTTGALAFRKRALVIPQVEDGYGHIVQAHVLRPLQADPDTKTFYFDPAPFYGIKRVRKWPAGIAGFTTYTFTASSFFGLQSNVAILADVLWVGGGAAGGTANYSAGGGGAAGDMIDKHDFVLSAGYSDGAVIIGAGGLTENVPAGTGCGGNTIFANIVAMGGGAGGEVSYGQAFVMGQNGGSGGGGTGWNSRCTEYSDPAWGWHHAYGETHVQGEGCFDDWWQVKAIGGRAWMGGVGVDLWNSTHPYVLRQPGDLFDPQVPEGGIGVWTDTEGHQFWIVNLARGHDGFIASGGNLNAGGGGGGAHQVLLDDGISQWFSYDQFGNMQSANPYHGGHGRPCDIRGWKYYVESERTYMHVDWYAAGGAGWSWQPSGWSWDGVECRPGYGGAGGPGQDAMPNTGAGGGGGGNDFSVEGNLVEAGNGADGIVVIRIDRMDEMFVTEPRIVGYETEEEFGLRKCISSDPHCIIRHLPAYMTHDDESGDESCPRTYAETHDPQTGERL